MFHQVIDYIGTLVFGRDAYRYFQFKRAKKIARRHGYEVYKSHLIWLSDAEFLAARAEVEQRQISGIPNDRCYMLLEAARNVRAVPGNFAECGMRYGKSSLFLLAGMGADSSKSLHGFDSFEGLSTPGTATDVTTGQTVMPCRKNCKADSKQNTQAKVTPKDFSDGAISRLDCRRTRPSHRTVEAVTLTVADVPQPAPIHLSQHGSGLNLARQPSYLGNVG